MTTSPQTSSSADTLQPRRASFAATASFQRRRLRATIAMLFTGSVLIPGALHAQTATGWRGTGSDINWSTAGNWDNTTPNAGARDLFFGNGYDSAGATGSLISNNDGTNLSLHKIVFENASGVAGGDHAFTITGNGFTLFDFGGANPVFPQIANLSTLTQTFNLTTGQTITFNGTNAGNFAEILASSGDLVFSSGTKLDLAGTTTLSTNAASGKTITINGVLSSSGGANGISKTGAGTLVLAGANTFTGGVTATAGVIKLGSSSALGSGTYSISGTTTDLNGQTLGNALLSGGNFDVFTNSSATTANITSGFNQAGSGGVTISDFTVNGTGNINWSGAIHRTNFNGTISKSGSNTLTLSGAGGDYTNMAYSVNSGTLALSLSSGSTFNSGTVTVASGAFFVGAETSGVTNTIGSVISGAGGFTQSGAGTTILTQTNTYTGTTTLGAGTVSIAANNNLGDNASAVTLNGGTLRTTNTTVLITTHPVTIGASGGVLNIAGTATSSQNSRVIFDSTNTLLGSGALTVTGNGTLGGAGAAGTTNGGAGALILNKVNSFNGNITLQGGGLIEFGTAGSLATAATVTLGNEGEFVVNNGLDSPNAITVSGGTNSVLSFGYGNAGTYSGNFTLQASLTAGLRHWYNYSEAASGTFSGVISGAGALSTTGSGTLTLTGANTFAGGLNINSGGVATTNNFDATFGTGTVTQSAGTTLTFNNNATRTFANNFVINGGTITSNDGDVHLGTATSTIAISGATVFNRQYGHGDTRKKLSLDGIVSGSGAITFNPVSNGFSEGAGLLIGNNANTYSGTITVSERVSSTVGAALILGGNTALRFATVNDLSSGTSDTPFGLRFNPGITAPIVGALSGTGPIALQDLAGTSAAVALTAGGNNASTTYSGILSGAGSLTKTGSGTMTISGANTYTGRTTISSGTLLLGAAERIADTSAVTLSGGTLATGGFSETAGALTLSSSSVINLGTGASILKFADSSATFGLGTVSIYNYTGTSSPTDADQLFIGTTNSLTTSQLSQISFFSDATGTNFLGTGAFVGTNGQIGFTAVPEPSTCLGAALIASLAGWSQRRRFGSAFPRQATS